jgi:hypothetical protein
MVSRIARRACSFHMDLISRVSSGSYGVHRMEGMSSRDGWVAMPHNSATYTSFQLAYVDINISNK